MTNLHQSPGILIKLIINHAILHFNHYNLSKLDFYSYFLHICPLAFLYLQQALRTLIHL
jgi:hypothetical protein